MRTAEGKEYGYVILPIGIPADVTPEDALKRQPEIQGRLAGPPSAPRPRRPLQRDDQQDRAQPQPPTTQHPGHRRRRRRRVTTARAGEAKPSEVQGMFAFPISRSGRTPSSPRSCQNVGDRRYWEDWARDVAVIAERHITRIKALLDDREADVTEALRRLPGRVCGRTSTTPSPRTTPSRCSPSTSSHARCSTPCSPTTPSPHAQPGVDRHAEDARRPRRAEPLDKEAETLEKFYASVRLPRARHRQRRGQAAHHHRSCTRSSSRSPSRSTAERLGIVYTPVEIVDFILHSVQDVLDERVRRAR